MELLFERALLPDGIVRRAAVSIAEDGTLRSIRANASGEQATLRARSQH